MATMLKTVWCIVIDYDQRYLLADSFSAVVAGWVGIPWMAPLLRGVLFTFVTQAVQWTDQLVRHALGWPEPIATSEPTAMEHYNATWSWWDTSMASMPVATAGFVMMKGSA